jgi:hypothetical protein
MESKTPSVSADEAPYSLTLTDMSGSNILMAHGRTRGLLLATQAVAKQAAGAERIATGGTVHEAPVYDQHRREASGMA